MKKKLIVGGSILIGLIALTTTSKMLKLDKILKNFLGIRGWDAFGSGAFGASRGTRKHQGLDLIIQKGDQVISPINGVFNRWALPYASDPKYKGFEILGTGEHAGYALKVFYATPLPSMKKGTTLQAGRTPVATAQDLREKYGSKMTPHIHVEIRKNGVLINPETYI